VEIDQQTLNPAPLPLRWKMAWAVFFLALWGVGLSLQNPGLMADDSGEMAAAAACLGLPHPPGYPLFTLLGHFACGIPLGSPAFRINLFSLSALWMAVWVTVGTCRRMTVRCFDRLGSENIFLREMILAGAALSLFFARHVLGQALTAKGFVYTFTLLILSLLVDRLTAHSGKPTLSDIYFLIALWSLGLANHWQTQILWVPVLILILFLNRRIIPSRGYVTAVAFSLIGLSVYLVLPLRSLAHPYISWGDASNVRDFWWIVSRKLVSSTEGQIRPWATYRYFLEGYVSTMNFSVWPGFFMLALAGCVGAILRRMKGVGYALVLYIPSTLAVLFYAREEVFYLVPVYLASCQGVVTIGAVMGICFLLNAFEHRKLWRWVAAGVWFLAALLWIPHACRMEDKSRYNLAWDLGTNILQSLPRNSFFLAEGDVSVFPVWYSQAALGLRRDVAVVPSPFFLHPWGWAQAVRMRPVLRTRDLSKKDLRVQWNALWNAFGPYRMGEAGGLFISMDRATLLTYDPGWVHTAVPAGLIFSPSKIPTTVDSLIKRERDLRQHLRLRMVMEPEGSRGMDFVSRQILRYYADDSFQSALWLERKGRLWESLAFFNAGFQSNPGDSSAYSSAARVLGKAGYPEASVDLCRKGLGFDSRDAALQNNLRFSLHLAAMETREGKTERYAGLLLQARKFHWEFLLRSFKETADRLSAEKGWTQHDGI
jgi:tetratricopeptide (TPR) repeat protein